MKWRALLQFYHSEGGRNTAVHKGKKQRKIFSFIYCFRSKMKKIPTWVTIGYQLP